MRKIWSSRSWEEYLEWQNEDRKALRRVNALIKDIESNGALNGIGKPEQLRHDLSGWCSRRIDEKNRLVYRVIDNNTLEIAQCKGHYNL
ncbi:MAG: Txe/YoeB family addiction module toxin [Selenomonadaceae bacterium]|nr:Txe/YoeB family addiction module toxin [Selenomonadaceae bacterium]